MVFIAKIEFRNSFKIEAECFCRSSILRDQDGNHRQPNVLQNSTSNIRPRKVWAIVLLTEQTIAKSSAEKFCLTPNRGSHA